MDSWWAISDIEVFSTSFWETIALETALFKENSSRNASRFKVRNVRRLGIHINDIILILGSLMSSRFVIKCKGSIWFFLVMVWSLFIIDYMGLFFYNKRGPIIFIGDLPTTNIIEPNDDLIAFHYRSFGPFFLGFIISIVVLLTTELSSFII